MNLRDALNDIRQKIGEHATTSYTRNGCRVSMDKIPRERVVLDVDMASPVGKAVKAQCDLVLFFIDTPQNSLIGVPMELKSGNVDASEAIKQLQEGARIVEHLVPKTIKTICIPIIVHGGQIHRQQRRKRIKPAKINFRGGKFSIHTTRCGYEGNLAAALSKAQQ